MVWSRFVRKAGIVFVLVLIVGVLPATASADPVVSVVATGLDNPRGLDVTADGTLYIAEAGVGGASKKCFPSPEDPEVMECFGLSGAVTKVEGGIQSRVVTRLPSIAAGGFAATGPSDVDYVDDETIYVSIGMGRDPAVASDVLKRVGRYMGKILVFSDPPRSGRLTVAADLGAHEAANNPDGADVDSNPNAVLAVGRKLYGVDAGGNSLIVKNPRGIVRTVTTLPDVLVPPPFPGPPVIPMQAVPTSIARGPDRSIYVGQLTGFPFVPGAAAVYKLVGRDLVEYAGGFTNIMGIEFGPDGTLYVLQISTTGLLSGEMDGSLWAIPPGGGESSLVLGGGALFAPGGLAVGGDGTVYVSNCGICPGGGEVLAITP